MHQVSLGSRPVMERGGTHFAILQSEGRVHVHGGEFAPAATAPPPGVPKQALSEKTREKVHEDTDIVACLGERDLSGR